MKTAQLKRTGLFVVVILAFSWHAPAALADSIGTNSATPVPLTHGYSYAVFSGTSVPAVTTDPSGHPILTGGSTNIDYSISSPPGLVPLDSFHLVPIYNSQQVTYFDTSQNALYTDTAKSNINTLTLSSGEERGWIYSAASSGNPSLQGLSTSESSAYLNWIDNLLVYSPTLPAGTPVSLLINNVLDASFTQSGSGQVAQQLLANNTIGNGSGNVQFINQYSSQQPIIQLRQSQIFNTQVGAVLTLEDQLALQAYGFSSFSTSINAADTSYINIQDLTPGTSLISGSGINYSKVGVVATPEPSMFWIFGTALLALVAAAKLKARMA